MFNTMYIFYIILILIFILILSRLSSLFDTSIKHFFTNDKYNYSIKIITFIIKYHYSILIVVTLITIISTILGFPVLPFVLSPIFPVISKSEMVILANTFNILIEILLPWVITFLCIIISVIYYTFSKYIYIWYFKIPLLFTTIILFNFPLLMFFSSLFLIMFFILILYAPFFNRWVLKSLSSKNILKFLNEIGVLTFLYRLGDILFGSNRINFLLLLLLSDGLSLLYTIFARYYIFVTFALFIPLSLKLKIMLFVIIFICLIALLFRSLVNVSLVVIEISMAIRLPL